MGNNYFRLRGSNGISMGSGYGSRVISGVCTGNRYISRIITAFNMGNSYFSYFSIGNDGFRFILVMS